MIDMKTEIELKENEKIVEPSPARLADSLRDTGYTFETAVADVLDNSVSAGATKIRIKLALEYGGSPMLMIADNGSGMNADELDKALRYGSPARPSAKSLGKFGMGLKTASTAVCKKLTVISAQKGNMEARQWDIELIKKKDAWILNEPALDEYEEHVEFLKQTMDKEKGTLVVWENIDRLTRGYVQKTSKTQVEHAVNDLREHLSGVFYNFLQKGNGYPDLTIEINGDPLEPWDPFCRWLNDGGESRLDIHGNKPAKVFQTSADGDAVEIGEFTLNVYILPERHALSPQEQDRSRYKLDNQGFHVFREGRMITSGGWPNRLLVKDPHLNLMRVELSFDHKLDEFFQIDIKKSKIDLPTEIREEIKKMIRPARNEANRRYRVGNKTKAGLGEQHTKAANAISKHHDETTAGSQISAVDLKGEADVRNKFGVTKIKIEYDDKPGMLVQTKAGLLDGVLWTPALVNGNLHAVFINEEHEFYKRVYLPNRDNAAVVLAIDSLLWSLAEAEFSVLTPSVKRNLEEMRINVSRILRTLAEELPEIHESENIDNE